MTDPRKTTANDLGNALNNIASKAPEPQRQTYRGFVIFSYHDDVTPFPFGWRANDYYGGSDPRCGLGNDVDDCKAQIDTWYSLHTDEDEERRAPEASPTGGLSPLGQAIVGDVGTGLEPRKTFTIVPAGYGNYQEIWETVDGRSCRSEAGRNPFDFNGWWGSREEAHRVVELLIVEEQKSR